MSHIILCMRSIAREVETYGARAVVDECSADACDVDGADYDDDGNLTATAYEARCTLDRLDRRYATADASDRTLAMLARMGRVAR